MSAPHWQRVQHEIDSFPATIRALPVIGQWDAGKLREQLESRYQFNSPIPLDSLTAEVIDLLRTGMVHITHPRYFGLFNPSVREASVVADTLAALYNPQLAAWSHAPAVQELERLTLQALGAQLGMDTDALSAAFTSGGAESNLTAVLAAIAHRFPESASSGLTSIGKRLALYVSTEAHHSFVKIARMTGLGTNAVREVPVTTAFTMDVAALRDMIDRDARDGWTPLVIVATAGTTGTGVIDPLGDIADVAEQCDAWFHVDAAWGGAACMGSEELRKRLDVSRADSVTWDAHKWLFVPMGAGMFFCRHPDAVERAFAINTSYMPPAPSDLTRDPYATTAQWSRRAIGLKVFMALAELGIDGYARLIEHQVEMGDLLRARLRAEGWIVVNDTPLPLVCFTHRDIRDGRITTRQLLDRIYQRGNVWISEVIAGGKERVLRACITSFATMPEDVEALIAELRER